VWLRGRLGIAPGPSDNDPLVLAMTAAISSAILVCHSSIQQGLRTVACMAMESRSCHGQKEAGARAVPIPRGVYFDAGRMAVRMAA